MFWQNNCLDFVTDFYVEFAAVDSKLADYKFLQMFDFEYCRAVQILRFEQFLDAFV